MRIPKGHVVAASRGPAHPLCSRLLGLTLPQSIPLAYRLGTCENSRVPLKAAYLPSAASSTPDIRWWGAWWIHPTRSRSDMCTLHHPWSWPFGLEGHWWLYIGPAFAPGAAVVWKARKRIIPAQENTPFLSLLCVSVEATNVLFEEYFSLPLDMNLDHIQKHKYDDIQSLKYHGTCLGFAYLATPSAFSWVSPREFWKQNSRYPESKNQAACLCFKMHFQL